MARLDPKTCKHLDTYVLYARNPRRQGSTMRPEARRCKDCRAIRPYAPRGGIPGTRRR